MPSSLLPAAIVVAAIVVAAPVVYRYHCLTFSLTALVAFRRRRFPLLRSMISYLAPFVVYRCCTPSLSLLPFIVACSRCSAPSLPAATDVYRSCHSPILLSATLADR